MSFGEFVRFYGLARSEGLVLRYLADAYRALRQTVPEQARTEELEDLTEWLGELVRQVDSSLLEEWEALRAGEGGAVDAGAPSARPAAGPPPVTANRRAFRVLVRNALFRRVELAALARFDPRHWDELGELDGEAGWDAAAWEDALGEYFAEHDDLGTGPDARGPQYFVLDENPSDPGDCVPAGRRIWRVRQIFDDPAGDHDWGISAEIDLAASDEAGEAVVRVVAVGSL
jgi:uncharacterized protein DUF3516